MKRNKYPLLLVLLLASLATFGQANNTTWRFSPAFEILRSTHSNAFIGSSLTINKVKDSGVEWGIGIEYASSPEHFDNGFYLKKLRFIPVFGNFKYTLNKAQKLSTFLESSVGLSFNAYKIGALPEGTDAVKVSERGLYILGGMGVRYSFTKQYTAFLGMGFKGFNMSLNDLDINPHGVRFNTGITF